MTNHFISRATLDYLEKKEQRIIAEISSTLPIENALLISNSEQRHLMNHCRCKKVYFFSSDFPSAPAVSEAQCVGHMIHLPYAPESLDLIVLPHLLEFNKNSLALLQEVKICLSKRGHLLLFAYSPFNFLFLKTKKNPLLCPRLYLENLLQQVDLHITKTGSYFSFLAQLIDSPLSEWIEKYLLSHVSFLCNAYFIQATVITTPLTLKPLTSFTTSTLALALEMK